MSQTAQQRYIKNWRKAHPHYQRDWMRNHRGGLRPEHWPRRKTILGVIVTFSRKLFSGLPAKQKAGAACP